MVSVGRGIFHNPEALIGGLEELSERGLLGKAEYLEGKLGGAPIIR